MSGELKPIYRLIVRADGRVEALTTADDYRKVSSIPLGAGITNTTASAVTFNPSGNISAATVQTAIEELDSEKQETLTSGTTIKTINGASVLGSGDLTVSAADNSVMQTIHDHTYPAMVESDFYNGTTIQPFIGTAIASGTITSNTGEVDHPGICALRSAASGNTGYNASIRAGGAYYITGGERFTVIFNCSALTNITSYFGIHDSTTAADFVDGAAIRIVGTTLDGRTSSNSTYSTTGTNYTVTTGVWYRAEITINSAATLVTYELYTCSDGVQVWTDTLNSNIPTGASRQTTVSIESFLTGSAAAADLTLIDYCRFYSTKKLTR
jgi:hypothetical protein